MSVVELAEALDRDLYGGKAAALAQALAAGLPVPPGYALSWAAASEITGGSARLPPLALDAQSRWAVRSSAVDEDGATASFAGQHVSRLHVPADAIAVAVAEVVASGRTASARAYRERMGAPGDAKMAVVLQQMVAPVAAGVLFTRNPINKADEIWIEATWGLGEAVVMGLVTPDSWRLSPGGALLEHRPGVKDTKIVAAPQGGGTIQVAVDGPAVTAPCLEADQIDQLCRLAARLDTMFEGAHDVEFAFDPDGRLHLLQRRSITT